MKGRTDGASSGWRMNHPYMMGVYMVINAIRDGVLLVDGPDCAHYKGHLLAGKHDLLSTLYPPGGMDRILYTGPGLDGLAADRTEDIRERLVRAAREEGIGLVLATSLPACGIAGMDYPAIVRDVDSSVGCPVLHLPGESLKGDWLRGYGATLEVIARILPLAGTGMREEAVAVVGMVMDRTEGDHLGNIAEMQRLLGGLDLDLVCTWPEGGGVEGLARVAEAGCIVSLPAGRVAARILAERTGARLVETDEPVGVEGTRRWLQDIARALSHEAALDGLLERELRVVAGRLSRLVGFYFQGRRVGLVTDLHLAAGLSEMVTDLGCELCTVTVQAQQDHLDQRVHGWPRTGATPVFEPNMDEVMADLLAEGEDALDLVFSPGEYSHLLSRTVAVVEMGFPSLTHHVLGDVGFMGFRGVLNLVSRMVQALASGCG